MVKIDITQLIDDNSADFVFEVEIFDFKYKVLFSSGYYQKLTTGKIAPEELVKKSFEFLLEREEPESILPQFDLTVINRYFPEYEETIKKKII